MLIKNFKPFEGQHCETTATGSLLLHLGINLSEPMLFGLGEGLNFIIWNMKTMDFPFIGGRIKTDLLTQNISYKGILKTSKEIIKWFKRSKDVEGDFKTTAMLMEKAGTGGALFRNLYRDFLKESYQILKVEEIKESHEMFVDIARLWRAVSKLFIKAGDTKDIEYIYRASEMLVEISNKEKKAMNILFLIKYFP
ncbi:MAG TPA: BtrH N-terminal domain-containing protein [Atribacterota bacterium]|nr:BtrH N-terminal domain-containing protein [Atribacterota bacterium]